MSLIEWKPPSLQDSLALEDVSARKCAWHKAKKVSNLLVKCTKPIGTKGRDEIYVLVKSLEKLDKTKPQYDDTLKSLSSLVLCRGSHRLEVNAKTIYNTWILEDSRLTKLAPKPDPTIANLNTTAESPVFDIKKLPETRKLTPKLEPTTENFSTISELPVFDIKHPQEKPWLAPKLEPITASLSTTSELSVLDLKRLLGIQEGSRITCHGITTKNTICGNWICQKNHDFIMDTIEDLACTWVLTDKSTSLLEQLSHTIMCPRYHQGQSWEKFEKWMQIIPTRKPTPVKESNKPRVLSSRSTPVRQYVPQEATTPRSSASTVFTPNGSSRAETPDTTPTTGTRFKLPENDSPISMSHILRAQLQSRRIRQSTPPPSTELLDLEADALRSRPVPTRRETRSSKNASAQEKPEGKLTYERFSREPPSERLRKILTKVQSAITSSDERKDGFIYVYRRPNTLGESPYIKIGYSKNVENRMVQWKRQCGYVPEVLLKVETACAKWVEKLVHLDLLSEKRREVLVNGRCNGGTGCASKHEEWFEVSLSRATRIINGWADWIKCRPYDEDNKWVLKREWLSRVKLIFEGGDNFGFRLCSLRVDRVAIKGVSRDPADELRAPPFEIRLKKPSSITSILEVKDESLPPTKAYAKAFKFTDLEDVFTV